MIRHIAFAFALTITGLAASAGAHPAGGPAPPPHAPAAAALHGGPVAAVEDFHAALARGDAAGAASLLDPKATVFEEGYVERGKAEYTAEHLPADIAFTATMHERLDRRDVVSGTDMALVTSETRLTGVFKDKVVDRISIETMVVKRGPHGWRIVHIHWSGHAAPAPQSQVGRPQP